MGIAPYKYFTFDGVSSRNYDVYLTGTGVFNAPQRAVELLEIPGRNGNYALDQGRFNNITVTYKAGIVDYSESNFADKVSALRNWLCSKVGYKRLEDDYNPNEYRMAVFANGINVDHEDLRTGEFEITFECKPQRWLTSGETATAVANNGTLSNPTLFDSEPLLAVKGYGTIWVNGYEMELNNTPMGTVVLSNSFQFDSSYTTAQQLHNIQKNVMNVGDTIFIKSLFATFTIQPKAGQPLSISSATMTSLDDDSQNVTLTKTGNLTFVNGVVTVNVNVTDISVAYSSVQGRIYLRPRVTIVDSGGTSTSLTLVLECYFYKGSDNPQLVDSPLIGRISAGTLLSTWLDGYASANCSNILGNSTVSILGNPTYIDCDIGTAYKIVNSEIVDLNPYIELGSDLPKLSVGTNTFTYDNTVTELKVTPRYWKV